ncbi:hypothetical protein CEXT_767631 [Caerostris extrusa]|uniref:Uncharacterized protein n=1 Tax=Caerostris extrusa TaxID=172846 RepID=A0AAV4UCY3_CAEEX|nr:hypothetical protein CEXT_767631 [Caerostris extrusa]
MPTSPRLNVNLSSFIPIDDRSSLVNGCVKKVGRENFCLFILLSLDHRPLPGDRKFTGRLRRERRPSGQRGRQIPWNS